MKAIAIELRDAGTFIPAVAIKLEPANEAEAYLISRASYGGWLTDEMREHENLFNPVREFVIKVQDKTMDLMKENPDWMLCHARSVAWEELYPRS